jgi:cytochrome d ubiquinol oxidase subunit I
VIAGLFFSVLQLFPTGDGQGRMISQNQPVTLAAMEALFVTQTGAPLVILGQPNVEERKIDNPLEVPDALSFLTYRAWKADVQGLDAFPKNLWPENIALLYYSYHIMVGLGTIFIAITLVAAFLLWRGKLFSARWMLWILTGPPALAGLRLDAHGRRLFENGLRRQRNVHSARLSRHVHGAGYLVPVSGAARNRARTVS